MSEEPFVPTSNYPRREGLASKAKAHARAALAVSAAIEAVASIHFFAGVLSCLTGFAFLETVGGPWMSPIVGALLTSIMIVFVFRYARHAKWSSERLFGWCLALAAGSVLAFFVLPIGMLAVGIMGLMIYRGIAADLEARGMTGYGNGVPKIELRRILSADPYEVTPLE
ncbi:MAG TPA: hypothetical protein VK171_11915 [Fimbriimonas sp.]|nr:hypothetical protein [Fimbriimonas sp.]